jgi:hypothetical protein
MIDRSEWTEYERVPITDPDVLATVRRFNAPEYIVLRRCPVCGVRERLENGRVMADGCNTAVHYPQAEPDLRPPQRTGAGDDAGDYVPPPSTGKGLKKVRDLFGELP